MQIITCVSVLVFLSDSSSVQGQRQPAPHVSGLGWPVKPPTSPVLWCASRTQGNSSCHQAALRRLRKPRESGSVIHHKGTVWDQQGRNASISAEQTEAPATASKCLPSPKPCWAQFFCVPFWGSPTQPYCSFFPSGCSTLLILPSPFLQHTSQVLPSLRTDGSQRNSRT